MKFIKSSLAFARLEYRAMKFYPSSFVLAIIKSFVTMGIWLFVSLFLNEYASKSLASYNGDFVAYMVIGVVFFQSAGEVLVLPFQSLSTAFWEKRLEVYNAANYGIWAYLVGKFIWTFAYNTVIQFSVLMFAIFVVKIEVNSSISMGSAFVFYILFLITCFGIGLIGASNFFFLEVKTGKEPVTWITDVLARIFSGVYYPITVIPHSIRFVSYLIPHTYALGGIRQIMLNGNTLMDRSVYIDTFIMLGFCTVFMILGIRMLNRALIKAQNENGVGMII